MIYPQRQSLRPEKTVTKAVNIGNLINEKLAEKQKAKQTPKNPFLKAVKLSLESSTVDISVSSHYKGDKTLRQYVEILEQSEVLLKHKVEHLTKNLSELKTRDSSDNITKQSYYYGLEDYYTKSRKLMLQGCLELVDCKALLMSYSQSSRFNSRIQSISRLLTRVQSFLKSHNIDVEIKGTSDREQRRPLRQLEETISIQDKTISHLRQLCQHPLQQSFQTQKRLLRYEINRVFLENEKLKQQCALTYSQFLARLKARDFENEKIVLNQTIRQYFQIIDNQSKLKDIEYRHRVEKSFIQTRVEEAKKTICGLEHQLKVSRDQTKYLEVQKTRWMNDNARLSSEVKKLQQRLSNERGEVSRLNIQLQAKDQQMLLMREQRVKTNTSVIQKQKDLDCSRHKRSVRQTQLQQQVCELRQKLLVTQVLLEQSNSRLKNSNEKQRDDENSPVVNSPIKQSMHLTSSQLLQRSINEKVVYIEQYLRQNTEDYYLIFRQYKRKVQTEINQNIEANQRLSSQNQMILQWCKKIYLLLKRSDIPEETIQEHLMQLQKLQGSKISKQTKLQKLLEYVKESSIPLDKHQIKQVQQQLEEYIQTLKRRADIIKELSNQDGSSVATVTDFHSEAFTDLEDRYSVDNDRQMWSGDRHSSSKSKSFLLGQRHSQSKPLLQQSDRDDEA